MARLTNEDLAIRLAQIETKIDNIKEDLEQIKPLEKRIEAIERFRSQLKGASTVGGGLFTIAVAVVSAIIYHILGNR